MRWTSLALSIPSALVCTALSHSLSAQGQADIRAEKARYEGYLSRPSLRKRTDGRIYFARTGHPDALETLVRSYSRPEDPVDHNKYLIATIVMDNFASSADEKLLESWRRRNRKPIDAWMWFETLRIANMKAHRDQILEICTGRDNEYLRAAAFAALVELSDGFAVEPDLANWAILQLEELPRDKMQRALLIEGIAALVLKKKRHIRDAPWSTLCRRVIGTTFDDEDTPRRTQVAVARYLSEAFKIQHLGFQSRYWLSELERTPSKPKSSSGNTTSAGFAGIRTRGDHIVFVIDASDSMLKPVSNLKEVDLGPTTGGKVEKSEEGRVPTADDLDWGRIKTRFDAAREFLRVSLGTLSPDHRFSVILFGDEAIPLDATSSLVQASPANIKKAINELYHIETGPPTEMRPDGQLRGKTNLHGGIRLAYRMTKGGVTKKAEYADDKSMIEGCDTLFILSDGAPSTDDWYARDEAEEKDRAGDPESGVAQQKTRDMWFDGPYGQLVDNYLVPDVERLNLLRRCEIHCVGIGEANDDFLRQIVKVGHGEYIRIDSRTGDNAGRK